MKMLGFDLLICELRGHAIMLRAQGLVWIGEHLLRIAEKLAVEHRLELEKILNAGQRPGEGQSCVHSPAGGARHSAF